jgi:hypothetical protein
VERSDGPAPNGGIVCLRLGQVKEILYDFPVFGTDRGGCKRVQLLNVSRQQRKARGEARLCSFRNGLIVVQIRQFEVLPLGLTAYH